MSRSCSKKTLGTRAWRAAQAAASAGGMSEKRAGRAAPPANSVIYAELITSKRGVNSTALWVEAAPFSCFGGALHALQGKDGRAFKATLFFSELWNQKRALKNKCLRAACGLHCSASQCDTDGKKGQT